MKVSLHSIFSFVVGDEISSMGVDGRKRECKDTE